MKKLILFTRAIVFNILFYPLTVFFCIAYLPAIVLPRRHFMRLIVYYMRLMHIIERYVLGLDYEVRGRENLPETGSFLVAAKHFSAYETMKLHLLLDDPAVILKKELIQIPLWGWYARKADMIAVDRANREQALKSITTGAQRIKRQGRPIVIFPQGTRIRLTDDTSTKPYRTGLRRMYEATRLPVVPLALNSGIFWPRNAFLKRPGTVIFEFGPPIEPGLDGATMTERLEADLEPRTQRLLQEAREQKPVKQRFTKALGITLVGLALLYSALWYAQAAYINSSLERIRTNMKERNTIIATSSLSDLRGFPGKPAIRFQGAIALNNGAHINIPMLELSAWTFTANTPIRVSAPQGLQLRTPGKRTALKLDRLHFDVIAPAGLPQQLTKPEMKRWHESGEALKLRDIRVTTGDIDLRGRADIHVDQDLQPEFDATLRLRGVKALLRRIETQNIASQRSMVIAEGILNALREEDSDGKPGAVKLPLRLQDRRLYVSGLPVARIPPLAWSARPDQPR